MNKTKKPNVRLYEYKEDKWYAVTALYQSIFGFQMYATLGTEPDQAHTVAALS